MIQAKDCYVRNVGDHLEVVSIVKTETGDALVIATVDILKAVLMSEITTGFVATQVRRNTSTTSNEEKKPAGKPSAGLPGIVYRTRTVNTRSSENGKVAASP